MESYAYGNWGAVLIGVALFSLFVLSFFKPLTMRNWAALGLYEAFLVALFAEMYGFPLTIYLLSTLLGIEPSFGHVEGHLLGRLISRVTGIDLLGWAVVMVVSSTLIFLGFVLVKRGWKGIYSAKRELVTEGVYAHVRHPQYLGLLIITLGLLIQWPTLLTLLMWPLLALFYHRLTLREEGDLERRFGREYLLYRDRTPRFLPRTTLFKSL
jgi:protein-S-isoprenylcysteine O-methyltransferase Ste14